MKKLSLNKETVTSLNNNEMNHVKGGAYPTIYWVGFAIGGMCVHEYRKGKEDSRWHCDGDGGDDPNGGGNTGHGTCVGATYDLCQP
jgi:uncharacterized membrane protein